MDEYYCNAHPRMSSIGCDVPSGIDPYLNIELNYSVIISSIDKTFLSLTESELHVLSYVLEDKVIQKSTIVSWLSRVGVPEDAFTLVVKEIKRCVNQLSNGIYKNSRGLSIRVDFSVTTCAFKEGDEDEESNCLDKNEEEMKVEEDEDEESNCLDKNEEEMKVEEDEDNALIPPVTRTIEDEDNALIPPVTRTIEDDHGEIEYGYDWNSYWEENMEIDEDNRLVIEAEIDEDEDEWNYGWEEITEIEDEDEWNYGWEEITEIEDDIRFVPAAKSCIEGLKMVTIEEAEKCPICFEDFNVGVCMPCSHMFHMDCIQDWLNIGNSCPLCRFQLPTNNTSE